MKKKIKKSFLVIAFTFVAMIGLSTSVDAAYTYRVLKSYNYDFNTLLGTISNDFEHKYINVADDARRYKTTDNAVSNGWNYVRMEVVHYYKYYDLDWQFFNLNIYS